MPVIITTKDGEPVVQLRVQVPVSVRRKVKIIAAETGRTMPEVFAEAIETYLQGRK